jgi:hypothetical protein
MVSVVRIGVPRTVAVNVWSAIAGPNVQWVAARPWASVMTLTGATVPEDDVKTSWTSEIVFP